MKADDLKRLKDTSPSQYMCRHRTVFRMCHAPVVCMACSYGRYDATIANAMWKQYSIRTRGKMESYSGNTRLKTHILSAAAVKFSEVQGLVHDADFGATRGDRMLSAVIGCASGRRASCCWPKSLSTTRHPPHRKFKEEALIRLVLRWKRVAGYTRNGFGRRRVGRAQA